ncbi:hypothetical protein AJ85_06610 [Alkalihalobacillus alcalophilus ATCC 27647 = CGMCC 1.3604]|uniref:Uncharacterized protein n=1 Tax=Alkalihalobacillus alcalophilus ATCC 27647 = CGMCC 1.3604 TaxID=1218173 RepID=A0A4S4K0M7_ALKAL|nr:hypothetical protein [Alkalihalobacillus alcalophilus]YP_009276853.1 hypothetical protein BH791_gp47 [Bacillus phage BalMu-1]AJA42425.1 hypothetical protein BalMu1_B47 [Bacillus phage BalMu-1]AJA42481.1 hypothetical protein BalMu1_A47 [Bacillus phage BalMu-1]MED1561167.1 hypothetical protein [Alkalihalobacillus alcalophilus]THG91156.1 hypothetical protein AJ85_06610 [Alkalihalobacillus alcalophilus ATCC 27647 = CGMCC 1.3604]
MITSAGIRTLGEFLVNNVSHGQYRIGSQWHNVEVFQTKQTSNDQVIIYLNLDDTVSGTISGKRLIQQDGTVFDEQPENISKPRTKGLLLAFRYRLREVEDEI